MSTAISAVRLVRGLQERNLKYRTYRSDWATHDRPGEFGDMHGIVVHCSADDAPDANDLAVAYTGRNLLPGPLYNICIDDKGVIWLIGWGRANHAGSGDKDVYAAVIAESYKTSPPPPNDKSVDGNAHFYGVSMLYGKRPTAPQLAACIQVTALLCSLHGWSSKSAIAHREWTYTRSDPTAVDMPTYRRKVQAAI